MCPIKFDEELKKFIDELLMDLPDVAAGKMFGYPAYYINGKMFACVYENGVGIKVPAELAVTLLGREGIVPFVPLGRRQMKEWIYILRKNPKEYAGDFDIFEASYQYVATLREKS